MAQPFKLPDGWGRSVVGGRELITAPSKVEETPATQRVPEPSEVLDVPELDLNSEEFDVFPEMRPDKNGWIGDFHKDDLAEQFAELSANMDVETMNGYINDDNTYKEGKLPLDSSGYPDQDRADSTAFLAAAIKYGRMKEMSARPNQMRKLLDETIEASKR